MPPGVFSNRVVYSGSCINKADNSRSSLITRFTFSRTIIFERKASLASFCAKSKISETKYSLTFYL